MKYEIRKPSETDILAIHNLFAETLKDNFKAEKVVDPSGEILHREIAALQKNLLHSFDTNQPKDYFLIASRGEQVLGIIAYGKPSQVITEHLDLDLSKTPEIKSVYILPSHQGKGIGTLLFQKILSLLKEKEIKDFCLDSGYTRAQSYWAKKLGKPKCTLLDHWSPGMHHMIWQHPVKEILNH